MATFASIAESFEIDFNKELQKIFKSPLVIDFVVRKLWSDIYMSGNVGRNSTKLETDTARNQSFNSGVYSTFTQGLKKIKGQKTSNVTLEDTGTLRLSTELKAFPTFFELTADFEKKNGTVYDNFQDIFKSRKEFEDAVLTLSQSRYDELIEKYIIDGLQNTITKKLKNIQ